jgi:hypothetical protein
MATLTLRDQLATAEAELREIAEQSRAAHRAWADLDQKQTRKADEIRDLHRQIREEDDQ